MELPTIIECIKARIYKVKVLPLHKSDLELVEKMKTRDIHEILESWDEQDDWVVYKGVSLGYNAWYMCGKDKVVWREINGVTIAPSAVTQDFVYQARMRTVRGENKTIGDFKEQTLLKLWDKRVKPYLTTPVSGRQQRSADFSRRVWNAMVVRGMKPDYAKLANQKNN